MATALLLAVSGGVAPAVDSPYQASSYTLSEKRPARATAEHFKFDYVNPDDPEAKPPAVKKVVTILPPGARYDATVPGSCTASDEELTAQGAAACPADSAIGGGVITVDTGFPGAARTITADAEFFNNGDEFIFLNTVRGSGARTVIRAEVRGRRLITEAGMLPGTPPDGGAIDTVDVTVENVSREVDGEARHYITTPKRCRGRKSDPHWTTRVEFTYADGVSQTVPTHTPCRKPGQP